MRDQRRVPGSHLRTRLPKAKKKICVRVKFQPKSKSAESGPWKWSPTHGAYRRAAHICPPPHHHQLATGTADIHGSKRTAERLKTSWRLQCEERALILTQQEPVKKHPNWLRTHFLQCYNQLVKVFNPSSLETCRLFLPCRRKPVMVRDSILSLYSVNFF